MSTHGLSAQWPRSSSFTSLTHPPVPNGASSHTQSHPVKVSHSEKNWSGATGPSRLHAPKGGVATAINHAGSRSITLDNVDNTKFFFRTSSSPERTPHPSFTIQMHHPIPSMLLSSHLPSFAVFACPEPAEWKPSFLRLFPSEPDHLFVSVLCTNHSVSHLASRIVRGKSFSPIP